MNINRINKAYVIHIIILAHFTTKYTTFYLSIFLVIPSFQKIRFTSKIWKLCNMLTYHYITEWYNQNWFSSEILADNQQLFYVRYMIPSVTYTYFKSTVKHTAKSRADILFCFCWWYATFGSLWLLYLLKECVIEKEQIFGETQQMYQRVTFIKNSK